MILGMGVPELAVILVIVLVIFGPKNLPKIGSAIGKTVKNVREGMEEGSGDSGPSSESSVSPIEASDAEKDDDLR
ncbi:twin-arginine translocase TatA/TatE family subunit [Thermophilibacter provencensis]|uniref:Sec-independent protein translocase protein TatA n=1 Tax=Thermophilibacter provencensis TaxID=1852386 RepID=A0A921KMA5_9ACTN|nr:twin-arginine translocase TatA/TatE family subunit [Thermophilibacter provencensis]HJF46194.1 twin-arginine translocase TatA/TatE family subunit [Thermophilibacter provencensis]